MAVLLIKQIILKEGSLLVLIKVWNDKPIDISSQEIKNKVSQSISDYVIEHWNECVQISVTNSDENYDVEFSITL